MMGFNALPQQLHLTDVAVALLVVLLGGPFVYALSEFLFKWRRARRARRMLEAQGVKCLPRPFFTGNLSELVAINAKLRSQPMPVMSHATAPRLLPHLYQWSKTYGEHFAYWIGFQARYILREPEQGKELLSTKAGHFRKQPIRPDAKDLGGVGIVALHGEKWAQHRRILNPAFYVDRLKAMVPRMVELTVEMMTKKWDSHAEGKLGAIDVSIEFKDLTADIIAHTAFGSSFAEGKLVFELQRKQQELISKLIASVYIPGFRFLPTAQNRYRNNLRKRLNEVLSQIIRKRVELGEAGNTHGTDLLGLMLAANKGELHGNQRNLSMGHDELIDECKIFFFAGHETTATLLTYMFMLLATHPEWQERVREEVFNVCGRTQRPTADSLNHLKLVGMVMNETLRLYPSAIATGREAETDMKLGEILVPAGTVVIVPIIAWQQDERYWGADAKEFRPERFEDGVSKACKVPGTFLPFSFGPRNCIGQQFASIEAKMVTATILQRYRFRISPEYVHAPTVSLTMQPQFGMPILLEKL